MSILEKTKPQKWALDSLIERVCSENPNIDLYIGEVKKSQYNHKIKTLKLLFNQYPNIQICNENPTVYAWSDKIDKSKPITESKEIKQCNNFQESSFRYLLLQIIIYVQNNIHESVTSFNMVAITSFVTETIKSMFSRAGTSFLL
jgi:hypothetical protein